MSVWDEIRDGVRSVVLMQDRIERLSARTEKAAEQLADHDRRLVRIETLIELAQRQRLADDSAR
jgi:hypothetical protein